MGEATISGAVIDVDDATGLATSIRPYRSGGVLNPTPIGGGEMEAIAEQFLAGLDID